MSGRAVFRDLRNFVAGRHLGATQDRRLLEELIKVLLCKMRLDLQSGVGRSRASARELRESWEFVLTSMPHTFGRREQLEFDDEVLEHIDVVLDGLDLRAAQTDPFNDIFEVFTGNVARGQQGQFFTPPNAVNLLVELVDLRPGEAVLDPACGAGGFLAAAIQRLWPGEQIPREAFASRFIGIDKDADLARLASMRLGLLSGAEPSVYCADSLAWKSYEEGFPSLSELGSVDVVLTNPPFGSKIVATTSEVQAEFELGYQWRSDPSTGSVGRTSKLLTSVSPQILFLERCLGLIRPGGRLGMVVPESLISSQRYGHVVQFLRERADIDAVVGMPEELFKVSGSGGTHTKTCLVAATVKNDRALSTQPSRIFMAEARWCGNDSRGRSTTRDDLPEIASRFHGTESKLTDRLGYLVDPVDVRGNLLSPRHYDPEPSQQLEKLRATHELLLLGDLIDDGVLETRSGVEVGKEAYGTGDIPFVRTSDLSNWEVKIDPKHGVSDEVYYQNSEKQDVREGDILMVRDGTYLIGTCAFVSKYDTRIVFQSHLLKLRVNDPERLSPYLLLAALSSSPVRRQIRAKRVTMDIIDTLGNRVRELVLPIPKDSAMAQSIADKVRTVIDDRLEARELARQAVIDVVGGFGLPA